MFFIKTTVSPDVVDKAEEAIKEAVKSIGCSGIRTEEFEMAKNALHASSISNFESVSLTAFSFLSLRRCQLGYDLFDKQGAQLSILNVKEVNEVARELCRHEKFSVIKVGRIQGGKNKKKNGNH